MKSEFSELPELKVFRKYDIRGRYPDEVNEKLFTRLGNIIKLYMGKHNVNSFVIGQDYRVHSGRLASALAGASDGMLLGPMPTPCLAFSAQFGGMVTASHNPPEYNGLKLFVNGREMYTEEYEQLKILYKGTDNSGDEENSDVGNEDIRIDKEMRTVFLEKYTSSLPESGPAVFDLAGGAVCAIKEVFMTRIFDTPDPTFSRHSPEPAPESLNYLINLSRRNNKLGIAFDGDGDRVVVIDKEVILSDVLGAFLLEHDLVYAKNVVMTVDCSSKVFRRLDEQGYNPTYSAVGGVNVIKNMMRLPNSYGFEDSGHYYLSGRKYISDGPMIGLLISRVSPNILYDYQKELDIKKIKSSLPYHVDYDEVKEILEDIGATEFITIDGVKGISDEWSVLIRNSNTEEKARITIEYLKDNHDDILTILKSYISK